MLTVISGSVDPADVSNGFYPHLRKVGPNDAEFLDVLKWLVQRGAPQPVLTVRPAMTLEGPGRWLPAELVFDAGRPGGDLRLDAALVFNFPHVALVELKRFFSFGDPSQAEMYPGLRQPVSYVSASPIGAKWPDEGDNCYRPSSADKFDYGAEYLDATGRYRKERRSWAFGIGYGVWVKIG